MSRFAPLPSRNNGTAATDAMNWGDPGDYRNRGAVASRASAKAVAPAATKVSAAAPAAPQNPVKSAATVAAEAYAERAAKVMKSPAAIGKVKAAAELLGNTALTPAEIVAQLATAETDAERQQAEISDTWAKAIASENARKGFPTNAEQPAPQKPVAAVTEADAVWSQAIAKVNQINGFTGEAA